jgi:hypothetical protein
VIPVALVIASLATIPAWRNLPAPRGERLASDIAAEVDTLDEMNATIATAVIESGLRDAVETCHVVGDNGRAWSLYQLNADKWKRGHTKTEICSSNRLATRLAVQALRELGGSSGHWTHALRAYVGAKNPRDVRVASRVGLFVRLRRDAIRRGRSPA